MSARSAGLRLKGTPNDLTESKSDPPLATDAPALVDSLRPLGPTGDPTRRRPEPPIGASNPLAGRRSCAGCASPINDTAALILCWGCGRPLCRVCYWSRVPGAALHRCPSCVGRESTPERSTISGGRVTPSASRVSYGSGRIR
jgi:hypothetical protein